LASAVGWSPSAGAIKLIMDECKHSHLLNIDTKTDIRAYKCLDCHRVSLVVGKSTKKAIKFHPMHIILTAIKHLDIGVGTVR